MIAWSLESLEVNQPLQNFHTWNIPLVSGRSDTVLPSISTRRFSSKSWWGVVVLKSFTKVAATRSHQAALSFCTLFSRNCCKHDVPIRARVSFSASIYEHALGNTASAYLDRYKHTEAPVVRRGSAPVYHRKTCRDR
jgi:hypothetical protein